MVSRWLDPREERVWRRYRRMVTLLEGRLAHELTDATGLSMAEYTVLSNLAEAEERRFRVTELAEKMQWEQSRLSHQLRRMEERGLVSRNQAETDARGAVVTLTRVGLKTIAAAAPVHFEGVRKHAIDRLDRTQLDAFDHIIDAILDPLDDGAADHPTPP